VRGGAEAHGACGSPVARLAAPALRVATASALVERVALSQHLLFAAGVTLVRGDCARG
jgi:hypothetical protein